MASKVCTALIVVCILIAQVHLSAAKYWIVHFLGWQEECGDEGEYNHHVKICCNGHLYNRFGFFDIRSCCGDDAYDSFTSQCCNGWIIDKDVVCEQDTTGNP